MDPNPYQPPAEPEPPVEVPSPLEPPKLSVQVQRAADQVRIVNARRHWGVAAFLLLWLTIWTIGCIALASVVITQFSFFMLMFALPFWVAEIVVLVILGTMIAAREEFLLDSAGVSYRYSIFGLTASRRIVPLSEITSFSGEFDVSSSDDGEAKPMLERRGHSLRMHTVGKPLRFITGITREERDWLVHVLNESLASVKRYYGPIVREEGAPTSTAAIPSPAELPPVLELRPPSATKVPAPSDTTWRQRDDFDSIAFSQRGRITLASLGGILFATVFWNGIVGVFVAGLLGFLPDGNKGGFADGMSWWCLFFFLIPFELIGLLLILAFIGVLLEPFRLTRWIFQRAAVIHRTTYFGIGRGRQYEISELDRLELRKRDDDDNDDDLDEEDKNEEGELTDKTQSAESLEGKTPESSIPQADESSSPPEPSASERFESARKRMKRRHKQQQLGNESFGDDTNAITFNLALIDYNGADVCQIKDLSLGEACWMADVILRERSGWFAR